MSLTQINLRNTNRLLQVFRFLMRIRVHAQRKPQEIASKIGLILDQSPRHCYIYNIVSHVTCLKICIRSIYRAPNYTCDFSVLASVE